MAKRYVFGVWHGGNGYGSVDVVRDIERFATISDALGALESRARMGHWTPQAFNYVHAPFARMLCPNVDGSSLDVYVVKAESEHDALRGILTGEVESTAYSFGDYSGVSVVA